MNDLDGRQRPISADEYHAMAEAGILHEDDRIELIDGRLIVMEPIGWPHAHIVNRLTRLFVERSPHEVGIELYQQPQGSAYFSKSLMTEGELAIPGGDSISLDEVFA